MKKRYPVMKHLISHYIKASELFQYAVSTNDIDNARLYGEMLGQLTRNEVISKKKRDILNHAYIHYLKFYKSKLDK